MEDYIGASTHVCRIKTLILISVKFFKHLNNINYFKRMN